MPNAEKVNCVELTVVEGRCVYLNNTRIAGSKPYASENLRHTFYQVPLGDVVAALGPTVKQSLTVPAGVKECLTTQTRDRLEELREWVDQQCPEGVSGTADNVRWLLGYAEDLAASDLHKRLSDAVTLLYTHGVITEKMRAHARRNL